MTHYQRTLPRRTNVRPCRRGDSSLNADNEVDHLLRAVALATAAAARPTKLPRDVGARDVISLLVVAFRYRRLRAQLYCFPCVKAGASLSTRVFL